MSKYGLLRDNFKHFELFDRSPNNEVFRNNFNNYIRELFYLKYGMGNNFNTTKYIDINGDYVIRSTRKNR